MSRPAARLRIAATIAALFASALVIAWCACAGSRPIGDGSEGARLYTSRCRSCHALGDPASKPSSSWERFLELHAERARLTPAERDSVLAFLERK